MATTEALSEKKKAVLLNQLLRSFLSEFFNENFPLYRQKHDLSNVYNVPLIKTCPPPKKNFKSILLFRP